MIHSVHQSFPAGRPVPQIQPEASPLEQAMIAAGGKKYGRKIYFSNGMYKRLYKHLGFHDSLYQAVLGGQLWFDLAEKKWAYDNIRGTQVNSAEALVNLIIHDIIGDIKAAAQRSGSSVH